MRIYWSGSSKFPCKHKCRKGSKDKPGNYESRKPNANSGKIVGKRFLGTRGSTTIWIGTDRSGLTAWVCVWKIMSHKFDVFFEKVTKRIEESRAVDFSRAFDKVPNSALVWKDGSYGIQGVPANWFQTLLSNILVNLFCSLSNLMASFLEQGEHTWAMFFLLNI